VFNEIDRLNECSHLCALLTHYAELAAPDRHVWHNRRMELESADARELTRLHGELLAYSWVELNLDEPTARYRVTTVGLRALKGAKSQEADAA
jgi:hypothetical protein